jgi:RNA polymerase sigma-70 factor (ECF subfamily)
MSEERDPDWLRRALLDAWPRLFAHALALTHNRDRAEELLQDCALKVLATARAPSEPRALRLWFYTVLRHAWIDQLRRQRIIVFEPLQEELPEQREYPAAAARLDDAVALREAFQRLSPQHREVVALVDLAGFSYQETAAILAVPIGTVMSRVSRARRALIEALSLALDPAQQRKLAR